MSGMANAAVASFLVEAVHKYITGDLLGIAFLGEVGATDVYKRQAIARYTIRKPRFRMRRTFSTVGDIKMRLLCKSNCPDVYKRQSFLIQYQGDWSAHQ